MTSVSLLLAGTLVSRKEGRRECSRRAEAGKTVFVRPAGAPLLSCRPGAARALTQRVVHAAADQVVGSSEASLSVRPAISLSSADKLFDGRAKSSVVGVAASTCYVERVGRLGKEF